MVGSRCMDPTETVPFESGDEFVSFRGCKLRTCTMNTSINRGALLRAVQKKVAKCFPMDLFANKAVFGTDPGLKVPSPTEIV